MSFKIAVKSLKRHPEGRVGLIKRMYIGRCCTRQLDISINGMNKEGFHTLGPALSYLCFAIQNTNPVIGRGQVVAFEEPIPIFSKRQDLLHKKWGAPITTVLILVLHNEQNILSFNSRRKSQEIGGKGAYPTRADCNKQCRYFDHFFGPQRPMRQPFFSIHNNRPTRTRKIKIVIS